MVPEIRAAMERLVTDQETCRQQARNAVDRVTSRFTWAAKAQRMVGIYREVLENLGCDKDQKSESDTLASTS